MAKIVVVIATVKNPTFSDLMTSQVKTESLSARYDAVSQRHSERFSALEQAQVLVARFWETYEELEPWLGETETLITQLPPPAIDTDALRLQQDQMRVRERGERGGRGGDGNSSVQTSVSRFQVSRFTFFSRVLLCSPAAPERIHRRAQTPHRQAAEDRAAAGRAQPPGGGDGDAALHQRREALPGH